jgi:hypothetical protein
MRFALALWMGEIFWGIEKDQKREVFSKKLSSPGDLSNDLQKILGCFKEYPIEEMAVIVGPGSFTGLRVLLSSIHGVMLCLPKLRVFSPTFFDVASFVIKDRPLMLLAEPHATFHLGKLYSEKEEIFFEIPKVLPLELVVFDLEAETLNWADWLFQMPWDFSNQKFPMPFYGYEPIYKKKMM